MAPAQNPKRFLHFPLFQGALPSNPKQIPLEITAGIAFAAFAIPEVMGYTKIAGMPLVTGIYTILLPMLAFAIFGSSRHLVVGADSATAAIIASGLITIAVPESPQYIAYAGMIALLVAIFLLLAGLLQLGFLADFLSHPVLIGFLTGVGISISISQLGGMFGISTGSSGTFMQLASLLRDLALTNIPTLIVSLSVIGIIVLSERIGSKVPGALIAIIGAITASWMFDFSFYGINILDTVPGGLPHLSFPQVPLSDIPKLLNISVACFIIILAQSAATSRAYAMKFSDTFNENSDLIGLSLANAAAGISGTFVVNGSPTKTEMVRSAGGRTQLTQLTTVFIVLIVLMFFTRPFAYLPTAVLSSVVFLIGLRLIDTEGMTALHRQRPVEFNVALITAMTVVVIGVEQGIVIAILLSIIAHLRHSYRPLNLLLVPKPGGAMRAVPLEKGQQAVEGLLIYRFGSNLYFANENRFTKEIIELAKKDGSLKWFCISATNIGDIDFTAIEALKNVCIQLQKLGVTLVLSEVVRPVINELDRDGITKMIGRDHIFESVQDVIEAYKNSTDGLR
ncbi:SulP family inorganic anion transporter [Methanosarcina sp. WH1]|uniref:SulP family inorganic anion transporter n=1 Tax=Methanosarcina sp. WH1 TaxID=1434102 RepID=UPI0006156B33|nr:SulP family inorganic anion transporter [Methanosarcina sp. WH1]AKB22096.1 Sulfate permease [Methanosarcina sp. WH1]